MIPPMAMYAQRQFDRYRHSKARTGSNKLRKEAFAKSVEKARMQFHNYERAFPNELVRGCPIGWSS